MQEEPAKAAVVQSYADALKAIWATCCALAEQALSQVCSSKVTRRLLLESEQQLASKDKKITPSQDVYDRGVQESWIVLLIEQSED